MNAKAKPTTNVEKIRNVLREMNDPEGKLGTCEVVRFVTKKCPDARRCELTEVLVADFGFNPFTVRRQIQEVRRAQ